MSGFSVDAAPVGTIDWIASVPAIAVPVYQREYRWGVGACTQLLDDILAVGGKPDGDSHFIGSVLAKPDDAALLTLVDGQQRVTTILLLLAALHDVAKDEDPAIAAQIRGLLTVTDGDGQPRLRPHERYADSLHRVLLGDRAVNGDNSIETNYLYFRERVIEPWREVWAGLLRIEHVAITLRANANPQQVFESLNSTGEPLSDDELIHNYVHMGLRHGEQIEIERTVWGPIEEATGWAIRGFWRDLLILRSATPPEIRGERGIYRAFRAAHPQLSFDRVSQLGEEWVRLARTYGLLLAPERIPDTEVARSLRAIGTFGAAAFPLALGVVGEWQREVLPRDTLLEVLGRLETLFIRRALTSQAVDIGPMCREYTLEGTAALIEGLERRTPEDPSIRLALSYRTLPHPAHVLTRLQGVEGVPNLQVEHIHPQAPADDWSGGSERWGDLSTEQRARYRALLSTIGNLTLLEANLNQGAGRRDFELKKAYYCRSAVEPTKDLVAHEVWDAAAIQRRTEELIEQFLRTWPRSSEVPMDEEADLVKVVDLPLEARRGFLKDEFEYAVLDGEVRGEVTDIKQLFVAVFSWLWASRPAEIRKTTYGNWIVEERTPGKRYERLQDGRFLYSGWASRWLLEATQTVLRELSLDDVATVKFSAPAVVDVAGTMGQPTK